MRKKLPIFILALIILLQVFVPVYAASENEAISSSIYFCPFDTTSEGAGKALTSADDVVGFVSKNGRLPDNFITKKEAEALGWNPKKGNLNDVAPGKSIGGDVFKNKGNPLPNAPGRVWYEADVNISSGFRGSGRVIYSSDGLIYKTTDHYKTFTQLK